MKRALPLVIALCVIIALGAEVVRLRRELPSPKPARELPTGAYRPGISAELERELERLATLGYVAGSERAPRTTGVLTYDKGAAFPGLTLFTCGGIPEALLIDMEGNVVYSWSAPGAMYWARAFAMPNGDLLAIACNPAYMMKLDKDSHVIWRFEGKAHHDFAVMADGSTYVLVRETVMRPDMRGGAPLLDDCVVLLDPMGRELSRVSLLEAFQRTEMGRQWLADHPLPQDADLFHTNSIQVLGSGRATHVLLSIRSIDTVAIVDLDAREIVWAMDGPWHMQHEAEFIGDRLLLFDNLGLSEELGSAGQSRVLEIDVRTRELVWSYTAPGFFTHGAGAQQRLPNGNTLITESISGRIIEVTPDGHIVWEYVNPLTLEDDPDIILAILRAERLPAGIARVWVAGLQ
ncbi:MAG: aryl-sulfate sulfotransferase [Candidatus Eisenbacteria bacterium]|nr:aryl-sulfate sulfotransferase [Candidatus Eisenbacteria bacterium]